MAKKELDPRQLPPEPVPLISNTELDGWMDGHRETGRQTDSAWAVCINSKIKRKYASNCLKDCNL
jgi:hypothetical protein